MPLMRHKLKQKLHKSSSSNYTSNELDSIKDHELEDSPQSMQVCPITTNEEQHKEEQNQDDEDMIHETVQDAMDLSMMENDKGKAVMEHKPEQARANEIKKEIRKPPVVFKRYLRGPPKIIEAHRLRRLRKGEPITNSPPTITNPAGIQKRKTKLRVPWFSSALARVEKARKKHVSCLGMVPSVGGMGASEEGIPNLDAFVDLLAKLEVTSKSIRASIEGGVNMGKDQDQGMDEEMHEDRA